MENCLNTKHHHIEFYGGGKKRRIKIGSQKTLLTVTIVVANFLTHQYKSHFGNGVFQQNCAWIRISLVTQYTYVASNSPICSVQAFCNKEGKLYLACILPCYSEGTPQILLMKMYTYILDTVAKSEKCLQVRDLYFHYNFFSGFRITGRCYVLSQSLFSPSQCTWDSWFPVLSTAEG